MRTEKGFHSLDAKLISIIGPPAVGKTTLAEALATELPAELVREDYVGNPFLAESYAGASDARLPGQLYFLMSRVGQLSISSWPAEGLRVSDYGFLQDRIFARVRLCPDDMAAYERVARRLEGLVRPPDIVIHLDAAEPVLLQRIAGRGRTFERAMTSEFLAALRNDYNDACAALPCQVLRVDCHRNDLRQATGRASLLAEIRDRLGR